MPLLYGVGLNACRREVNLNSHKGFPHSEAPSPAVFMNVSPRQEAEGAEAVQGRGASWVVLPRMDRRARCFPAPQASAPRRLCRSRPGGRAEAPAEPACSRAPSRRTAQPAAGEPGSRERPLFRAARVRGSRLC